MNDLTKKLKKGKLPDGTYYFKSPNGEIDIGTDFRIAILFMSNDYDKIEVLEQVPSYEQWQAKLEENIRLKSRLKELRKVLQKETPALRVENAKLKTQVFLLNGLLEKWLPEFDCYHDTLTSQFCKEARQVLGEE